MIRKFFGMMLFIATILTASFGENIVGRSDIDRWATGIRQHAPAQASIALKKTDVTLAKLATHAGTGEQITCTLDNPMARLKA